MNPIDFGEHIVQFEVSGSLKFQGQTSKCSNCKNLAKISRNFSKLGIMILEDNRHTLTCVPINIMHINEEEHYSGSKSLCR